MRRGAALLPPAGIAVLAAGIGGVDHFRHNRFSQKRNDMRLAAAAASPVPPPAPIRLRCFDADANAADLAAGRAKAYALDTFAPPSDIVAVVAAHPDGYGYLRRRTRAEAGGAS
jgi:hypothetical protein